MVPEAEVVVSRRALPGCCIFWDTDNELQRADVIDRNLQGQQRNGYGGGEAFRSRATSLLRPGAVRESRVDQSIGLRTKICWSQARRSQSATEQIQGRRDLDDKWQGEMGKLMVEITDCAQKLRWAKKGPKRHPGRRRQKTGVKHGKPSIAMTSPPAVRPTLLRRVGGDVEGLDVAIELFDRNRGVWPLVRARTLRCSCDVALTGLRRSLVPLPHLTSEPFYPLKGIKLRLQTV